MALWFLMAIVVFNVRFDWQSRMAGLDFVSAQVERQQQGLPVQTINEGFRPMIRDAAVDAAMWLALIMAAGVATTYLASKTRNA